MSDEILREAVVQRVMGDLSADEQCALTSWVHELEMLSAAAVSQATTLSSDSSILDVVERVFGVVSRG